MKSFKLQVLTFAALLISSLGCSQSATVNNAAVGGTLLGAGIGAGIGAAISDGNIPVSAGIGGLVGLAGGILIGQYLDRSREEDIKAEIRRKYILNQQIIRDKEYEIQTLRDQVIADSPKEAPHRTREDHIYTGATLGNPTR